MIGARRLALGSVLAALVTGVAYAQGDLPLLPAPPPSLTPVAAGPVGFRQRDYFFDPPPRSQPLEARLVMVWGPYRETYSLNAEGLAGARALLGRILPGSWPDGVPVAADSGLAKILDLLAQDDLRQEVLRIASLGDASMMTIELHAGDDPGQLYAGEVLTVPAAPSGGGAGRPAPRAEDSYTVQPGDTLSEIAARLGTSEEAIQRLNRNRFQIWPHRSGDVVRLGEVELSGRTLARNTQTLLHEAAHIGDASSRCADRERYGPDGKHYWEEILTPVAAFKEGWADFHGWSWGAARSSAIDRKSKVFVEPPEGTVEAGFFSSQKVWLDSVDEFLGDSLSNERQVARILDGLSQLAPGKAGIERAFRATHVVACRTIKDLLRAFVQFYPETRDEVRDVVERVADLGAGEPAELATFQAELEGIFAPGAKLPNCQDTAGLPRSRIYLGRQGADLVALVTESVAAKDRGETPGRLASTVEAMVRETPASAPYVSKYPWNRHLEGVSGCGTPGPTIPTEPLLFPGEVRDDGPGGIYGLE